MAMLGPVVGLIGSGVSAIGAASAGSATAAAEQVNAENARRQAAYEAAQLKFQGESDVAGAQQTYAQDELKLQGLQSSLISRAAASGGGATDTTVLNVSRQLQTQGETASLTDLWNGLNKQTGEKNKANAVIYQGQIDAANDIQKGEAAQQAGDLSAVSGIIGGVGGLFKNFDQIKAGFG